MDSKRNRYILIGLSIFCILFIGITSITDEWLAPFRTGVGYFLIPIQSGVNKVGSALYEDISDFKKLKQALQENDELKQEIASLTEESNRSKCGFQGVSGMTGNGRRRRYDEVPS